MFDLFVRLQALCIILVSVMIYALALHWSETKGAMKNE